MAYSARDGKHDLDVALVALCGEGWLPGIYLCQRSKMGVQKSQKQATYLYDRHRERIDIRCSTLLLTWLKQLRRHPSHGALMVATVNGRVEVLSLGDGNETKV